MVFFFSLCGFGGEWAPHTVAHVSRYSRPLNEIRYAASHYKSFLEKNHSSWPKQTQLIIFHHQPAVGLCFNEQEGVQMSLLSGNLTHPPAFSSSIHARESLSCTAELGGILIHTVAGLNPYIWILTKLAARDIHNTLDFDLGQYVTGVSPLIQNMSNKSRFPTSSVYAHCATCRNSISVPPTWVAAAGRVSFCLFVCFFLFSGGAISCLTWWFMMPSKTCKKTKTKNQ